jgi:hypothetical protein
MHRLAASALALVLAVMSGVADAQSPKLEAAYVVLGPQGPVARAVFADATTCPAITIDGAPQQMTVRARPDAAFPVLVCELLVPTHATSAILEGSPLPLPKTALKSIAAFGDTGCRLKAAKSKSKGKDPADDEDGGKFQDCNDPSLWPFARRERGRGQARPRHPCRRLPLPRERLSAP